MSYLALRSAPGGIALFLMRCRKWSPTLRSTVGKWIPLLILLSDASVAALGEHQHPLGRLPGSNSGMVLNIGAGLCAGFYVGEMLASPAEIDCLRALGALGRWLEIDPVAGIFKPGNDKVVEPDFRKKVADRVFLEKVIPPMAGCLRTSPYLSSAGIILRLASRAGWPKPSAAQRDTHTEAAELLTNAGWDLSALEEAAKEPDLLERFTKQYEVIANNPSSFARHRVFADLNEIGNGQKPGNALEPVVRELVIEVAREISEVVVQIEKMMDQMNLLKFSGCTKNIVLTGAVGEHFGRVLSGEVGREPGRPQENDLLIATLNLCLGQGRVRRSEIATSAVREAEGFVYHMATERLNARSAQEVSHVSR